MYARMCKFVCVFVYSHATSYALLYAFMHACAYALVQGTTRVLTTEHELKGVGVKNLL